MKRPLRLLISAGPTREPIDPVRFISNYSTGYMGAQLATEALTRGHRVTVVSGPSVEPLPRGARVIPVERAEEMERALRRQAGSADAVIMAAAVSDFRPAHPASQKLPRSTSRRIRLVPTTDIIANLPRRRHQLVIGFALETDHVISSAKRKLRAKRLDLLLAQEVRGANTPFGRRRVHAWLLERGGKVTKLGDLPKQRVARALLDKMEALWYGQRRSTASRETA